MRGTDQASYCQDVIQRHRSFGPSQSLLEFDTAK